MSGLTPRKVMLCVMILERNRSLRTAVARSNDSNLYCQQLERLRQAVERKRPELINRKGVHRLPSGQHIFGDPLKIERTWLGSFIVLIVLTFTTIKLLVSISELS